MIAPVLLATVALALTGHSTQITCQGIGYFGGQAFVGQPHLWLSEPTCRQAARGDGAGVRMLLHEIAHTVGITDEHQADCFARDHLRAALQRFWRFKPRRVGVEYRAAIVAEREGIPQYGCIR